MLKMELTVLCFFIIISFVYTQKIESISISANTEAIGFPFTNYLPYHPGLECKLRHKSKENESHIQHVNATLGAYYHKRLETGIYLGAEYQFTHKLIYQRLGLDYIGGLGYLHSFYPNEIYKQKEDGDFKEFTQHGRAHLYVNAGIGLTYLHSGRIQTFIRQELVIVTPFANEIPIIPHSFLKIGVNIKMEKNEK